MKIAVVSEFTADEAALKVLIDAILGAKTDLISATRLRPMGWTSVFQMLPAIIKDLHYNRPDADGLVVVIDSDESPLHDETHEDSAYKAAGCRLCSLRGIVTREFSRLSIVPNRGTLKVAIGLAVPAIEAWYRCGFDPHITEFEWARKLRGERLTYDKKSLKESVYGSDPVSNIRRIELAKQAALRLTANLDQLEQRFPNGFGSLLRDLSGWL